MISELIGQMADLVNEQDEAVNRIVDNMREVRENAEQGQADLGQAVVYSKKGLKRRCCTLLLIIVGALVLFAPILLSILNAKGVL